MPDHHGNAVNTLYSVSYEVIYTHPLHYQTQHHKAPDMESRVGYKMRHVDCVGTAPLFDINLV